MMREIEMIDNNRIDTLTGATVLDNDGDKIGSVGQVYIDPATGNAAWLTVKTGLFGTGESFVPAADASFEGDDVRVGYAKDFVKDAPRVDADAELDENDTDALYDYYGVGSTSTNATTDDATTDDAMTRSEEHLQVGTERVETGRARLHKYVVTEQETVTVPVSHEEVRVVTEPITDGNVGDARAGPAHRYRGRARRARTTRHDDGHRAEDRLGRRAQGAHRTRWHRSLRHRPVRHPPVRHHPPNLRTKLNKEQNDG
jgi:sporulation protein YlmC with PRC-barrel domain